MASKQSLTLPNEIWIRVVENLSKKEEDLPDAWMTCRHVSTAFKAAVETVFREIHLSKTWIAFLLGEIRNEDDERVLLDASFDFDRLSEEKNVAIFKMDPGQERYHKVLRRRLQSAIEDASIHAPVHTIQIRRSLNDTPIPGLSVDYENWELSCDWRGLYTCFYGEEQLCHRSTQKWVKDREAWTSDIQKQVARGEIDMIGAMEKAIRAFAGGADEAKKMSRRARIRRQYQEEQGYEYDFEQDGDADEEKAILKKLGELEQLSYFEEYSDDEDTGEGAEDEGDGDSDEEDEWEDEEDEDDEDDEVDEEPGDSEHDDENTPV